jgi:hypothetical protein
MAIPRGAKGALDKDLGGQIGSREELPILNQALHLNHPGHRNTPIRQAQVCRYALLVLGVAEQGEP